jgi:hypothetical protein
MKKNVFSTAVIILILGFFFSGCVEHRYYQKNHQHSNGYNHRHHRASAGVDINIHN